jgi:hypothetical protein
MRFCLSLLFFFACISALDAQVVIDNQLSENHQQVAGTKLSLIPPDAFEKASNFNGFQHGPTNSVIMVMDIPGPYAEVTSALTKENLLKQGVATDSIVPVKLGEFSGLLISGTQSAYGREFYKYILVFGSEQKTLMINGIAPNNNAEYKQLVYQALTTLVFETDKVIDPFEALDYTIDLNGNQITLGTVSANALIYTADGEVPTKSEDKTALIVTKAHSNIVALDKKQYALKRFQQMPFGIDRNDSSEAIEVDGLEGIEIYATGENMTYKDNTGVFQIMLFKDDTYYLFTGSTNQDDPMNRLKDLKEIVLSFRLK